MIQCRIHQVTMTSDATCKARLAELIRYETQGARIGIVSNSRYQELLLCRTCQGEDATPKKIKRKPVGKNGGRSKKVKTDKPCINGADHGRAHGRGLCERCYQRAYRKGKF